MRLMTRRSSVLVVAFPRCTSRLAADLQPTWFPQLKASRVRTARELLLILTIALLTLTAPLARTPAARRGGCSIAAAQHTDSSMSAFYAEVRLTFRAYHSWRGLTHVALSLAQDVKLVRRILLDPSVWHVQNDGRMWSQLRYVVEALKPYPEALERRYGSMNGKCSNAKLIPVVADALEIRPDNIKDHRVQLPGQLKSKNMKGVFFRPEVSAQLSNA